MNCHGNNKGKEGTHNHSPIKHMLHMIICCGLPIAIILLLPFISNYNPSAGRVLGFIAPFICPLMMIMMIPMMMSLNNKSDSCEQKGKESNQSLELN